MNSYKKVVLNMTLLLCIIVAFPLTAYALENSPSRELKVLVISLDPVIENPVLHTKQKASDYLGFPLQMNLDIGKDVIERGSNGYIKVSFVQTIHLNEFPKYLVYPSMTEEQFFKLYPAQADGKGTWYGWWTRNNEQNIISPKLDSDMWFDYDDLIKRCNLVEMKNQGLFDQVWLFGIDPLSAYETCMVGRSPIWINGAPIMADCDNFVIAGMAYTRPDGGEEGLCHYFEGMMCNVYRTEDYNKPITFNDFSELNNWEKFYYCQHKSNDKNSVYGVGQVHFSPNSFEDYDWANLTPVQSYHEEFITDYPNITGKKVTTFTANDYLKDSLSPAETHHVWWMQHFPHFEGRDSEGYLMNWWDYVLGLKYTINVTSAYKPSSLKINKGDVIEDLKIVATCHDNKKETISVHKSGAPVTVSNTNVVRYENGTIFALSPGTSNVSIKYDGFNVIYKVTVQDGADDSKESKLIRATIKAAKTTIKKGKKTTVKITANSGGQIIVKAKSKNAKNTKYVKIKNNKITFQKKTPRGIYKFTVTCAAKGKYKKTTKTIRINVK